MKRTGDLVNVHTAAHIRHFEARGLNHQFWETFVVPNVKRIKGHKCEHCASTKKLDVHHTSYVEQTIHTLLLLCEPCHYKWHRDNEVEDYVSVKDKEEP